MTEALLRIEDVSKRFTLHHQHGAELRVLDHVNLEVASGECVVLGGPSGMGKSTLLKLIYANYRATNGHISLRQPEGHWLELSVASPRQLMWMRKHIVGYVSQFLRVIPRVSALDIVTESLVENAIDPGHALEPAREQARARLERLRIPERLWHLPPATFSGGEQLRINIARNLIRPRPLLLLDEPTASLDADNARTVVDLIHESLARGTAVVGIFHDASIGSSVATRHLDVSQFRSAP